jgi:hypothetical protein
VYGCCIGAGGGLEEVWGEARGMGDYGGVSGAEGLYAEGVDA